MKTDYQLYVLLFVTGFLAAFSIQLRSGWWLNPNHSIIYCAVAFVGVGAAIGAVTEPTRRMSRIMAVWLGIQGGLTWYLFSRPLGTIWPIVIGVDAMLTVAMLIVGMIVGDMLHSRIANHE